MIPLSNAIDAAVRHHQAGRLAEAEAIYRQVLNAQPRHADALYLMGRLTHERGQFAAAEQFFRQAIDADSGEATFHHNLAETLRAQRKNEQAIVAYREALRLKPDYALAYNNLANALQESGAIEAAEATFRQALQIQPEFPEVYNNLGAMLRGQKRYREANACLREALRLKPDFVAAHNNLGNLLRQEGRLTEAINAYRRALEFDAQYAPAHFNLGLALRQSGRVRESLEAYREAARLNPRDAETLTNLGVVNSELGELDEAVEHCRQAVDLRPTFALAQSNLASCLHSRSQIEDAIDHYRLAADLNSDEPEFLANYAHALHYAPGVDAQDIFSAHVRWGTRHADPLAGIGVIHANDPTAGRRLRIGYVSPNFREHAVSVFTEPILAAHDHEHFEIVCYSDVERPDAATARFQAASDCWIDIAGQSDSDVAQRIRDDRVDILVDLTGHLDHNRLLAFARKPAPIQVTYIGYQNTTGMRAMDYRLTDDFADPLGVTDCFYTEKLIRLPQSFFCYRPLPTAPDVTSLPALDNRHVTFGSFNKFAKVTGAVLSTWARILSQVPDSRLMILADGSDDAIRRTHVEFLRQGISSDRVEFVAKRPRRDYLNLHGRVDIALDTFPFNGHTTTCEALWMGVPVVMLAGQTYVTRFGGTALANLELHDLITETPADYVHCAVSLAEDLDELAGLRRILRPRMAQSPLLDAQGFTRKLEAEYQRMWAHWCEGTTGSTGHAPTGIADG